MTQFRLFSSKPHRPRSPTGGALFWLLPIVSLSCAGRNLSPGEISEKKGRSGAGRSAQQCQVLSSTSRNLSSPGELELPESQIWLSARFSLAELSRQIAQRVPTTLAQERDRPVGAPGRATYQITRGAVSASLEHGLLRVRTPVYAEISLCKPFGSTCIRYGRCSPSFATEFSVRPQLNSDYSLNAPSGSVRATSPCRIGIDVTEQLVAAAKKEVGQIQHRIASQLSTIPAEIEKAWTLLAQPLWLDENICAQAQVHKTLVREPRLRKDQETVLLDVGATFSLVPARSCEKPGGPLRRVAPETYDGKSQTSRLWLPEPVSAQTILASAREKLSGNWSEHEGDTVTVERVNISARGLAGKLRVEGRLCGQYWFDAPLLHQRGEGIRLAKMGLSEKPLERELATFLRSQLLVKTRNNGWFSQNQVDMQIEKWRAQLPAPLELKVTPNSKATNRVVTSDQGVYVLHKLAARLELSL